MAQSVSEGGLGVAHRGGLKGGAGGLDGLFDERNIGGCFPFMAVVVVVELRGAFIH